MITSKILIPAILVCSSASVSLAQSIATYDFTGGSQSATSVASMVSASTFDWTRSAADTYATGVASISSATPNVSDSSDEAGAVEAGSYFGFTVTPDAGYKLDLTSLSFDVDYNGSVGASGQTTTFFVRSDVGSDAFATTIGSPVAELYANTGGAFVGSSVSISLSDIIFQDIQQATTFRIYLYDSGVTAANRFAQIDNVTLSGSVSMIPEPGTWSVIAGLGALIGVAFRRPVRKGGRVSRSV